MFRVKAFLVKRVGDTNIADDMLQEVFLKYMSSVSTGMPRLKSGPGF